MIELNSANIDLHQTFPFQGMGRSADDGEVAGPQVSEHPLPPGWHKEGGRATTYFEYVIILKKEQFLSGPTRVGKTRPA